MPGSVHVHLPCTPCELRQRPEATSPLSGEFGKLLCWRKRFLKSTVKCRQHHLHAKNLREAAALHSQLLRQLAGSALLPGIALPRSPLAPELPSQKVLLLLQRAIAAGWADQVGVFQIDTCIALHWPHT